MESVRELISTTGKKQKYKHNEKEAIMNKQTSTPRNKEHGQD